MRKHILSMILVLSAIFAMVMPQPIQAASGRDARESVVPIVYYVQMQDGIYQERGTGFFVGENGQDPSYIVTNFHVIEDYIYSNALTAINIHYNESSTEEAYFVDGDPVEDLAILRVDTPCSIRKPLPLKEATDDMVTDKVYAVGFPAISDNNNNTTNFSISDATVTDGTIGRLGTQSGTGRRTIQTNAEINGGNSGGPLVNEEGYCIGVNTYHLLDDDGSSAPGMFYAVNAKDLMTMLDKNAIKYSTTTSGGSSTGNSGGNNGGNSEDSGEATTAAPAPTPKPAPEPTTVEATTAASSGNGMMLPIIIGAVIAAVIVLLLIIMLLTRKPAAPAPAPAPMPAPAPAPAPAPRRQPRAYITSLSTQHRGSKIPVTASSVTAGRDPSCAVVYAANTKGISRLHCSISFDASTGDFIITDLNSSYGTFLSTGTKLPANSPYRLKPGSSIYLGEPANSLRMEVE